MLCIAVLPLLADAPPPPNSGGNTGTTGDPLGGGTPVGNGLAILLSMGLCYGIFKLKSYNTEKQSKS